MGASTNCVICGEVEESSAHLFHYRVVDLVWAKVVNWLEVRFVTPPNPFIH